MIQFIIFAIILGTFLYTQKDKIIDKISQLNLNLNLEGFQMNNLFSLEKPKILKTEVNLSLEGIPVITNDSLNDFNNIISHKLQEFVPLRISDKTDFAIMNLNNVNNG
jgi:hypothetical protein